MQTQNYFLRPYIGVNRRSPVSPGGIFLLENPEFPEVSGSNCSSFPVPRQSALFNMEDFAPPVTRN